MGRSREMIKIVVLCADTIATSHGVNGRWKETMTPFPPSSSRRGMKKSSGETGLNKNRLNILNI